MTASQSSFADASPDQRQEIIRDLLERTPKGILIEGTWRDASGGETFDVENPATGEVLASVASGTEKDALAGLDAASAAQEDWARTPARERSEILRRAFDLVQERREDLALLMTLEMGKPFAESLGEVTDGDPHGPRGAVGLRRARRPGRAGCAQPGRDRSDPRPRPPPSPSR